MTITSMAIAFIICTVALTSYIQNQRKQKEKQEKIQLSDDIQKRYFDAYEAEIKKQKEDEQSQ